MLKWLFAIFLLVPLVDAAVLVYVGTQIGWVLTILLVVLTALVGSLLVRAEGRRTITSIQQKLVRGDPPANNLIDGGLLIAAGALLVTPGLVTDLLGFLFAIPLTRRPIRSALKRWVIIPKLDKKTGGFTTGTVYTYGFPDQDNSDTVTVNSTPNESTDNDDSSRERNS